MLSFERKLCEYGKATISELVTSYVAGEDLDEVAIVYVDPDSGLVFGWDESIEHDPVGYVIQDRGGSSKDCTVNVQLDNLFRDCYLGGIQKRTNLEIEVVTLADGTCQLRYCDLDGQIKSVDVTKFLDDTNLPQIVSGVINGDGDLVLTRDDGSVVTIDLPDPEPDTVSTSFDPATCELTTTVNGISDTTALPEAATPTFDPLTCELVFPRKDGPDVRQAITNINTGYDATTVGTTDQFINLLGHDENGKAVAVAFPAEKELKKIWTIDLSGENGVDEQYWDSNGTGVGEPQPNADNFPDIDDIFYESNGCTIQHPNSISPDQENVGTSFRNTDPFDVDVSHQSRIETYIHVPSGGAILRFTMAGQASGTVYLASCSDKLARKGEAKNTASGQLTIWEGFVPQGIYHAVGFIHDGGSAGALIGQWSLNGGVSFPSIPAANLYRQHPAIEASCVWVEFGSEDLVNLDGTPLDLTDKELAICDPCENTIQGGEEDQCFVTNLWCIDGDAEKGVREEYWDTDGTGVGAPVSLSLVPSIGNIFSGRDGCDYPLHPNFETPDAVNILTTYDSTDPAGSTLSHQNHLTSFLYVPEDGTELFIQGGGQSSNMTFLGVCGGKKGVVNQALGTTSGTQSVGIYPKGIYALESFVHDPGTFGRISLRWRLPGGGQTTVPADNLFLNMPSIICKKVIIKKGSKNRFDLDGKMLDSNLICFECNPCENNAPITPGGIPKTGEAVFVSSERVVIDASNTTTAAITPPPGANGAQIQVIITDPAQRNANCINYYTNGSNPTATVGRQAGHKDTLNLGCKSSNGASVTDSGVEVSNFRFHRGAVTSGNVVLEIDYFTC